MIGRLYAATLVAALAAPQTKPAPPTKPGTVSIVGDADDPRVRSRAQEAAASAWTAASLLWGGNGAPSDRAPSLHLYREIAEYEKACDRLVGGHFKPNLGFTEWANVTAHVVLQPPIRGDAEKQLPPTEQTLRMIAHETAHLARLSELPNAKSHPGWIADGAATWVETKSLAAGGRSTHPDDDPDLATQELVVQRLLNAGKLPQFGDLLLDKTDALEFFDRYATRWLLFRFLCEGPHAEAFRKFLDDVRREGGGDGFKERIAERLQKRLGAPDWKALDAEFRAWIGTLAPKWEQVYPSLDPVGDDWTQTTYDDVNAIAWRTTPVGGNPYAIAGSVTTYADRADRSQANLLIGRADLADGKARFLSFAIEPGFGVTVFDFDGGQVDEAARWKQAAFVDSRGSEPGKPLDFRVDCVPVKTGTEVALTLAGRVAAKFTVARALDGPWGVGAQAGSSCVWHKVRLGAP